MIKTSEKRSTDERGYAIYLSKDDIGFAHYVFTYEGYARGGFEYQYDKDVTVCFGKLLYLDSSKKAKEYCAPVTFTIPSGKPTLVVALENMFIFTNHRNVVSDESKPNRFLMRLKDKINSGENLEELLAQFKIVRS